MKHKKEIKEMERKKLKRILVVLVGMLFITSVSAYWLLSYDSGEITGTVTGGISDFTIISDLTNFNLDVSNSLIETQNITIDNDDGDLTMIYNLTTSFNNTNPECDFEGDINYYLLKGVDIIQDEGNFTMESGVNDFELTIEAKNNRVCDGIASINITFIEV